MVIPLLFFLFLTDGLLIPFLTKADYGLSISIFPRLVLVTIVYIAVYHRLWDALLIAFICGILTDLLFGRVYGVYTISMVGVVFISIAFVGLRHPSFFYYMIVQLVAISSFEIFVFGLQKIYGLVTVHFAEMILYVMLPTLIFNLLWAAILYPILNRLIGKKTI